MLERTVSHDEVTGFIEARSPVTGGYPSQVGLQSVEKETAEEKGTVPAVACVVALSLGIHFFGGGQTAWPPT